MILGNNSATTYCLCTPSSLLLLAKLTGSTGSFPLLVCTSLTEPAEGAHAEPNENASLVKSSPTEPARNAPAEPAENAPAEPAENAPAEPSEIVSAEPAEDDETRAEPAEEEWAAVRG